MRSGRGASGAWAVLLGKWLICETHPQCRECVSVHRGVQWFGKAETQNCDSPLSL